MTPKSGLELIFLGTGTSHGVPMIGCDCPVCRSDDPRDRRYRASAAVRTGQGRVILIDAAPELRLAAIANDLRRVDAVLLTHAHADHIMGLDDVRRFNDAVAAAIGCYGNRETIQRVGIVFDYATIPFRTKRTDRPCISLEVLSPGRPREICGVQVLPVPLLHGRDEVLGFRIGGMAYCTDVSAIPEESWPMLQGLEVLVLDALRHTPHPAHFNLQQALETIRRLGPARTLLTHLTHEMPHRATSAGLPAGVELAYDTLRVRFGG